MHRQIFKSPKRNYENVVKITDFIIRSRTLTAWSTYIYQSLKQEENMTLWKETKKIIKGLLFNHSLKLIFYSKMD